MRKKTYGRGPAKRWLTRQARLSGLTIVRRNGTVWWFVKDGYCNIRCLRYGRFILRNVNETNLCVRS